MWKRDFEAIDLINKAEGAALRAENTRLSKKQANEKVNDAWEFELAKSCGRFQLALELLKHPLAAVHTLLESWQQYITSSEHRSQKARAKRHWPEELTQEISEEKQQQRELKLRLFRLRNLRRRMKKYSSELSAGKIRHVPQQHAEFFERYVSGHFDQEIDALTEQHGFGLLRTRLEHLGPLGLTRETRA